MLDLGVALGDQQGEKIVLTRLMEITDLYLAALTDWLERGQQKSNGTNTLRGKTTMIPVAAVTLERVSFVSPLMSLVLFKLLLHTGVQSR